LSWLLLWIGYWACTEMGDKVSQSKEPVPRRPRSVTILAVLQALQGLGLLALGIYRGYLLTWLGGAELLISRVTPYVVVDWLTGWVVWITLGIFTLILALAIFRMQRLAWLIAISLQGLGLLVGLVNYIQARPNYAGMIYGIVLVFYLNQQEVRSAFREA